MLLGSSYMCPVDPVPWRWEILWYSDYCLLAFSNAFWQLHNWAVALQSPTGCPWSILQPIHTEPWIKKSRLPCALQGFYCWIPVLRHLRDWVGNQARGFLESKDVAINITDWILFFPANRKPNEASEVMETSCPTAHPLRHLLEGPVAHLQLLLCLMRTSWDKLCKEPSIQSDWRSHLVRHHRYKWDRMGRSWKASMCACGKLGTHKRTDSCHMMMSFRYLQLKQWLIPPV